MLTFKPITIEALEKLMPFAQARYTQSCDYTPGNLIMWARFMDYHYCIEQETLFVSCKSQADMQSRAYLPPVGRLPLRDSLQILKGHCNGMGEQLRLTAVPEEWIDEIKEILPQHSYTSLDMWSDYIYSAESLATLKGKALNKKRNRYNKFITENSSYTYNRCTDEERIEIARYLAANRACQEHRHDNMRCYEHRQCIATVKNLGIYNQPAGVLRVNGNIAAFTLGEVFGNTLYVHIEKADHNIAGASEAINRLFVNDMLDEHPEIEFVNREEDLGDPGLRQVKRAYNPIRMLDRYEVIPQESNTGRTSTINKKQRLCLPKDTL